jgi:hypothetical protein
MVTARRFGTRDLLLLLVLVAAAAGTRAWYLHACAGNGFHSGPLQVQDHPAELDDLAHNLTEQHWFGVQAPLANSEELTAHVAPGYTWLLSWLELAPVDIRPVDRTVRWIQCGLGALTAGLYFLFALRVFGSLAVASLAGLLCAFHPFWIVNTAEMSDGVLVSFLLAVSLFLGARAGQTGAPFSSYLYGLTLAGLALVRAALLPVAIVGLIWFLFRSRTVRRGWLCATLAVLGLLSGLAPWTFRNYQRFHDIIPVADSTFLHLWMGNNPRANGEAQDEQTLRETLAEVRGQEPKETAETLANQSQPERYASLAGDVVRQIRNDPAAALRHRLEAGIAFFFSGQWLKDRLLWRTDEAQAGEMPAWLANSYPAIFYGALLGMLLLGVLGWRWTYGWRREAMPSSLALMWIALPYLLSHAETLHGPRLPIDGVLWCYAAFALVSLFTPAGRVLLQGAPARVEA